MKNIKILFYTIVLISIVLFSLGILLISQYIQYQQVIQSQAISEVNEMNIVNNEQYSLTCSLKSEKNSCFEVLYCEYAGETCYRYIYYRCLPDGNPEYLWSPEGLSRCWSKESATKRIKEICKCVPDTPTPFELETPSPISTITSDPSCLHFCGDQCLYPCQIEDQMSCKQFAEEGCVWCFNKQLCINTTSVAYCDDEGNIKTYKPYESCGR